MRDCARNLVGKIMIKTITFSSDRNIERARAVWVRCHEADPDASAFMSWEWMGNWIKHFSGKRELQLAFVEDSDGNPIAMIPTMRESVMLAGITFSNKIQLLGSDSLACAEHLGFLQKSGQDGSSIDELLSFLWEQYRGKGYLVFPEMDTASRDAERMDVWSRKKGVKIRKKSAGGGWQTSLPDSWDGFLSGLSSNFRQQIRRSIRKIENSPSLSLQRVTGSDAVTAAAEKLIELNLQRMSSKGVNSCFNNEQMRSFFVDMSVDMVAAGRAWMDLICSGDTIVATSFHLVDGGTVSYYQGGFDERFAKLRPMVVLFAKAIQRAIDSKVGLYDFLGGNEPYKQRWGAMLNPYLTLSVLPEGSIRNSLIQTFELYQRAKVAKQYYFP